MELFESMVKFIETLRRNYPDNEKLTIKDYLDTFAEQPPSLKEDKKCAATAQAYWEKGTILFQIGCYKDAVTMYTRSLREAPPYSKFAAQAYVSRSIVLMNLKAYEECLSDIDRALDLPCSDTQRLELNSLKESATANLSASSDQTTGNEPMADLQYARGNNAKIPGLSHGIDIECNPREGRNLVAKMPFKAGDVLFLQDPFLAVVDSEKPACCHNCLKKSLSLIPCDTCCNEVYCSEKCRTEAYDNYHRIECKIQSTLTSTLPWNDPALLCQLRCLNVFTEQGNNLNAVYDDLKEVENNSDPERLGFTGEQFIGNTRKAFLSLLSDKKIENDSATLYQAAYIVMLLRNYTDFFKTNNDIPIVAELLMKLNSIDASNRFAIEYFGTTKLKTRATWPLSSLMSHACVNNTIAYIDENGRMVLRASQNIRPGDKILSSFGVEFCMNEISNRSGRMLQRKRVCKQCDTTYSYPPEKPRRYNMSLKLRTTLQENPHDIEGLWKLLNIVSGKNQRYTLQTQMVKIMLADAYAGRCDSVDSYEKFRILGIL